MRQKAEPKTSLVGIETAFINFGPRRVLGLIRRQRFTMEWPQSSPNRAEPECMLDATAPLMAVLFAKDDFIAGLELSGRALNQIDSDSETSIREYFGHFAPSLISEAFTTTSEANLACAAR